MAKKWRQPPPYDHQYRFEVKDEFIGYNILSLYNERFAFKPESYWLDLIQKNDITVNHQGIDENYILKKDDVIRTIRRDIIEPKVNEAYEILFQQNGILILNKPAPLPVHPSGRFFKNTLTSILKEDLQLETIHTIHRLDLWTTGVLILATEKEAAKSLHLQVENQNMGKSYGVLAKGNFPDKPFEVNVPIGRVRGVRREAGNHIPKAKESKTVFFPICRKDDLTLLKAIPVTGRTNQIRAHIHYSKGFILNDPLYSPTPIDEENIDFMGLHCREMTFMIDENTRKSVLAPWPDGFHQIFGSNLDKFEEVKNEHL